MENVSFKYNTLDEIAEDCARRSLGIRFQENIEPLYQPIEIAGRKIGNRLAVHPMEGSDATDDGKPGELTFHRWGRFATGGAKLIWGEAAAVVPEGRSNPRQLALFEENAKEFAQLVKQTRRAHRDKFGTDSDLLVGIQLTHAGRHCFRNPTIAFHSPVHDRFSFLDKSSGIPLPDDYPVATDDYLERLEDRFVEAARLARNAGFDFVDIKQCHSYLLNELLAARSRPGKYGGSFDNRTRFIRNVVRKIKEANGDDMLIACRMNVFDGVPFTKNLQTGRGVSISFDTPYVFGWGVNAANPVEPDLSEPKRLIELLYGLGVRLFSVSCGSPYWSPHLVRPFTSPVKGGYSTPEHPLLGVERMFRLTAEVQEAFPTEKVSHGCPAKGTVPEAEHLQHESWDTPAVPVVGAGYSWLRQFLLNAAAANVMEGKVSIVGAGRASLAYPDFVDDGHRDGKMNPSRVCLADSMCSNMLRGMGKDDRKIPAGCAVRDSIYKDLYKFVK